MSTLAIAAAAAGGILFLAWRRRGIGRRREGFIDDYVFPDKVTRRLAATYPQLSESQLQLVVQALRDYFHLCRASGRRMVAMPSQAVDVAWHEFILFTRTYQLFCRRAFGRFLHHTPAEAMSSPTAAQKGIRRAWQLACRREGIDPRQPTRLPLLFALDAELGIADGFRYALDCSRTRGGEYCASHIGCGGGGGCGGDSGASGCSSGCGGGCGGGD